MRADIVLEYSSDLSLSSRGSLGAVEVEDEGDEMHRQQLRSSGDCILRAVPQHQGRLEAPHACFNDMHSMRRHPPLGNWSEKAPVFGR